MRERRVIAILASGLVAVAAIVVIVVTAVQPVPEFPPLSTSEQTGFVAYVRDDGQGAGVIQVVDLATGESVEVDTGRERDLAGWDEQGNLLVREYGPTQDRVVVVDPATGERLRTTDVEQLDDPMVVEGAWAQHRDGRVVIERDADGLTSSFPAPDAYDVTSAATMGSDRVVFVDELGRVAVAPLGDDVTPVLVADDALPWWQVTARE